MDYDLANNYAEQIKQGGGAELYQKLANMCTSYLLYLRKKLGFHCIPVREISLELAADAVSDAIIAQGKRNLPFTICLHNTFRDRCRQRHRVIQGRNMDYIMDKCGIASLAFISDIDTHTPSAEVRVQNAEQIELANKIMDSHDRFSKRVINQKMKGSTYPEMADIFGTTLNECKRIFWHDMNHIRKQFGQNYEN